MERLTRRQTVYIVNLLIIILSVLLFYRFYLSEAIEDFRTAMRERDILNASLRLRQDGAAFPVENAELILPAVSIYNETDALLNLGRLMREYNLTETHFKILPRVEEGDYLRRPIEVSLTGSFRSVIKFITEIQRGDYYYMPDSLELSAKDVEEGEVSLSLQMYLYVTADNIETSGERSGEYDYEKNPFYYDK